MSRQHLDWACNQAQLALLEFANVQQTCPPGVYVSTTPGAPSVWQGVYFVRRGTYCPAVLRFQVILPPEFPEKAPAVVFASEVFHPLVVPFSTYTFSSASPPRRPQGAGSDEHRLAPGSLNLAYAFPEWFRKRKGESAASRMGILEQSPPSADVSYDESGFSDEEWGKDTPSKKPMGAPSQIKGLTGVPKRLMFIPPPAVDALEYSSARSYPGIAAVLEYMVQAFEDDQFLDSISIDDAANNGAFHAWHAHRARVKELEEAKKLREKNAKLAANANGGNSGAQSGASTPRNNRASITSITPGRLGPRLRGDTPERRDPSQWDWSGVWLERVRKCVKDSISEAKLYKEHAGLPIPGRDEEPPIEMIKFLDLDKDDVKLVKDNLHYAQREATAAKLDVKTNEKAPQKPNVLEGTST